MSGIRFDRRGVVLLIVLGTLLVVASLATVILSLILSQRRLTHHQTSRIQAYYASMAGMNYALEQLRTKTWIPGTNCTEDIPCYKSFDSGDFKPEILVDYPGTPTQDENNCVLIVLTANGSSRKIPTGAGSPVLCTTSAGGVCVDVTATYTYVAP